MLAGILLWQPVLEQFAADVCRAINLYSAPWLNLPILFGSAVLATAVLTWTFRPQRTDRQRAAGVFAGVLLASLTFATISVYLIKGFSALLAIAVGLLVLAWWERSVLLAVVGTLFTAVSVPANHWLWEWDTGEVFARLGWTTSWRTGGSSRCKTCWCRGWCCSRAEWSRHSRGTVRPVSNHPTNGLSDVVHQKHRLGILTIAAESKRVEFGYLKQTLELTGGNLSRHLTVLVDAGLLDMEKGYDGQRPKT